MESFKTVSQFQRKELNCPERDLNQRSPAYMADALTHVHACISLTQTLMGQKKVSSLISEVS